MSFREKAAWITLVTVLAAAGFYVFSMVGSSEPIHEMTSFHYFLLSLHVLVLGQIVLRVAAWLMSGRDERAARDEREMKIQWRANSLGYYIILLSLLAVGIMAHLVPMTIPGVLSHVLLAIVIATLVSTIAQIVMFRRGA